MFRQVRLFFGSCVLAATILFPASGYADQASATKGVSSKAATKVSAAAPTDTDIANAKAKGLVWVNTDSKVYHKDGQFYGKTKKGQFMTEADAQKGGYRAAKESAAKKKSSDTKKQ
jgi:hypothetical protein